MWRRKFRAYGASNQWAASAKALTPTAQPWKWIQEIIKNFIEDITESNDEWLVFIDTNPSFCIYTQIAVSGAERLLVPINADNSSKKQLLLWWHYCMVQILPILYMDYGLMLKWQMNKVYSA